MHIIQPLATLKYLPDYTIECIEWFARRSRLTEGNRPPGALIHDLLEAGHMTPFDSVIAVFDIVCDRGVSHDMPIRLSAIQVETALNGVQKVMEKP